jgi:hypothetical protein
MNLLSESAIRSKARRLGFVLQKARTRNGLLPEFGTYRLLDRFTNYVVLQNSAGGNFGETLGTVSEFLNTSAS